MKACLVNPYLDTLGGGERYTVSFAKVLADMGWRVDMQWDDGGIGDKIEERFGIGIDGINIVSDVKRGDGYDLCFWLSDGSVPLLRARKNILHFQFPFVGVDGRSLINKMKMFRISYVVCNSEFTKRFIDKEYGVRSVVIYPPVDVDGIKAKRKENIILGVGRFSQLTQAKNQHVLVNSFKRLSKSYADWKLVLVGGSEVGGMEYVNRLRRLSKSANINIVENPSYNQLKNYYGVAKIFWSAVGFGSNENREPMKVEHFGISLVEAMAAGAVPIAFDAGGQKEIVEDNVSGVLWSGTRQLISKTKKLIDSPGSLRNFAAEARLRSRMFSYEIFRKKVIELL